MRRCSRCECVQQHYCDLARAGAYAHVYLRCIRCGETHREELADLVPAGNTSFRGEVNRPCSPDFACRPECDGTCDLTDEEYQVFKAARDASADGGRTHIGSRGRLPEAGW